MDFARYQPLRGGSYLPLPAAVRNKKAVINPENMDDDDSLEWTFLIAKADPQPPHLRREFHGMPPRKVNVALLKITPQRPSLRFQNSKNCLIKPSKNLAGTAA